MSAADRAGNLDEATIVVADQAEVTTAQPRPRTDGPANVRLVNSKRIKLDYKVEEVGRSGISVVELWLTRDGRNWQKFSEDRSAKSPYVIDVPGEGLYGFTLVVQSGVGLSDSPPQVGDKPQVWVEVDLTKPDVRLKGIEVGRGYDAGNLTINWSASDKNLAERPIRLTYAEKPDDNNWKLIAENLENTGRYVWRMPVDVPYRFYVRVEAADRAGNIGVAETTQSIIVDLAKPKGIIVDVAPGQ
ncbi:MAG: hypothetical protein KatS3mg105_3915 [Gemmatales bacterium]|nr:MAG: hypothetical protein KatS3mg105_3915 [Gemmatales bacterium]